MSRLPPVPPASRPAWGPDAVPKTGLDATPRVRRHAPHREAGQGAAEESDREAAGATDGRARGPAPDASPIAGLSLPMVKLGLAGFAGYVLGYLAARRR